MADVILWAVVGALLAAGILGSLLPVLPGTPVILGAAVLYTLFKGLDAVSLPVLIALAAITALAQVIDWLVTAYGAKRYRASRWGVLGGIVGGVLGMIMGGLPGLILGIFTLALVAEWVLGGRALGDSVKVGWGALLGFLGGTLAKVVLALVMTGIFLYAALA